MDRIVKGATVAPVGVVGAAMWMIGSGVSFLGKSVGATSVADAGGSLSGVGTSAMSASKELLDEVVAPGYVSERNRAVAAFEKHANGAGYLDERALEGLASDMPELSIGLEGIVGTHADVLCKTAELILNRYAVERSTCLNWEEFFTFWKEVVTDHEGRLSFYHHIIFRHYDTDRTGSLTRDQTSLLLDELYYSPTSAFSGDHRIPQKDILLGSLCEDSTDEKGDVHVTLAVLGAVLRGDFCATAVPEAEDKEDDSATQ